MAPSDKLKLKKPAMLAVPAARPISPDVEPAKFPSTMPICEILPQSLFLGGIADACNPEALKAHRITHILSLTFDADKIVARDVAHKHVPMDDSPDEDIASHFEECFSFMKAAQDHGGRLLIHCQMGISRAPTIVIAFLMKHHHFSFADALLHVKARRPIISPRLSFLFALEAYEHTLACERDAVEAERVTTGFGELSVGKLEGCGEVIEGLPRWEITTGPAWC